MVMVTAFAAILGMHLSLRCRTTVWAVMSSVGIVMGVVFGVGFCGYHMVDMNNAPDVGLALGSFSPFTLMTLQIDPWRWAGHAFDIESEIANIGYRRVMIFIFGYIAAGGYAGIVWWMYKTMVKNFDMTIRRQSR